MLFAKYVRMDEADDGAGGSAGSTTHPVDQTQQIELLTKSVGLIAEGLQKLEGNQTSIMDVLAKVTDQSKGDVKADLQVKFGEDVDVEQLDRKQFAAYLMDSMSKSFRGEMAKMLGEVDTKVSNLAANFESKNAQEQIGKTAADNPDFWEWSNEIKSILKENPTLTVNRAYHLVKAENPNKAKELSTKYAKPADKKEQSFLGLTPTSSIGTREGTGKMTAKEAAEKAFDKVMGDLGDVLKTGDRTVV